MALRTHVPRSAVPFAQEALRRVGHATSGWRVLPGFVVVGGQRCGTTSIFKGLADHPQVMRPPVEKGTDFFSMHYDRGPQWYRGNFPLGVSANLARREYRPRVAFEACTYYMFHPFAIERMARDLPDVKIVAMLRDPVERAYSAYKHEFARGYDTEPDFMRALQLEDERLDGADQRLRDPAAESFAHRHHSYRRRGQFAEQLARVFEHYPRERVHVMESEAFFADPASEYRALIDFLGLQQWQPDSFEAHNARPSRPMPSDAQEYLSTHFRPLDAELSDVLGRAPFWAR